VNQGIRAEIEASSPREAEIPARLYSCPAVLAYGFRIFFLLGALSAVLLIAAWIAVYAFGFHFANHFDLLQWHAHEMLFGFAVAIIAGFLLTAPGNWTGRTMPKGNVLGGLALLWLAGRVISFFSAYVPGWFIMIVDVSFLPALGWVVYSALRGAIHQRHNLILPFLLCVMTTANVLSHLRIRNSSGTAVGTELMLYLVLLLITIMGGRMIPGFTQGQFPNGTSRSYPWVDRLSVLSLIVLVPADLMGAPARVIATFCAIAGIAHAKRLIGWHTREIWRVPLLWILHTGYTWLVVGFFMKAGALIGMAPPLLFRHAFTAGTIGVIILGMISRITLGHTGRPLRLPRFIVTAFLLVNLCVVFRVIVPWMAPSHYLICLQLSAGAWIAAYGIYLIQYGPMLCRPRADGRPG